MMNRIYRSSAANIKPESFTSIELFVVIDACVSNLKQHAHADDYDGHAERSNNLWRENSGWPTIGTTCELGLY